VCDPVTGKCSNPEKPDGLVLSFQAEADTYTDVEQRMKNFGASTGLRVDGRPGRRAYLRFKVTGTSGLSIQQAVIRMHTTSALNAGSDYAGDLHTVSNNTWNELTLTHDDRPPIDGPLLWSLGPVEPGREVEFDVTPAVTSDGIYSFGIEPGSSNMAIFYSREGALGQPELRVVIGTACDDGDVCTEGDLCIAGRCLGEPLPDSDADGFCDAIDLCPQVPDSTQADEDHDGVGDHCQCTAVAPGRCIGGGGDERTDCLLELTTTGPVTFNRRRTKVKNVLRCSDGDPACDLDGARDGQCTFGIAFCFGNTDPRYPRCKPSRVHSVEVVRPSAAKLVSIGNQANGMQLEQAFEALGLEVRRRDRVIADAITPVGDNLCSPLIRLATPAPKVDGGRPRRRRFQFLAQALNGRRDKDRLTLVCR
jgi:hypothetical protein